MKKVLGKYNLPKGSVIVKSKLVRTESAENLKKHIVLAALRVLHHFGYVPSSYMGRVLKGQLDFEVVLKYTKKKFIVFQKEHNFFIKSSALKPDLHEIILVKGCR